MGQGSLAGRQTPPPKKKLSLSVLSFVRVCIATGFELAGHRRSGPAQVGGERAAGAPPRADSPACWLCPVSSQWPDELQAPGEHTVCLTCSLLPDTQKELSKDLLSE